MRYFRMLTNAVLAGALAAVYIVIVFLQVKPAPAARSASAVASACCRGWLLCGASGGVLRGGPRNSDRLLRWDPDQGEGVWNATEATELSG